MGLTPALLAALAFAIEVRVSVNPSSASTDTESEHAVWQQHGPFRTHLDTLLYGFREFELTVLLLSGGSAECRRTCDSSAAAWRSYLPHANISVVHGLPEFGLDLDVVVDCGGRSAEQQSQDLRVLFGADGSVGVKPGGMLVHELCRLDGVSGEQQLEGARAAADCFGVSYARRHTILTSGGTVAHVCGRVCLVLSLPL